jgi:hypothetical protein
VNAARVVAKSSSAPVRAMCGAMAATEDGKYVGAASRRDGAAARLAALKDCEKNNAGECAVRFTECNQ